MAKLLLILSHDEVHRDIPYSLVCETHNSAQWNTGRRRRAWEKTFSESERKAASRLFRQADTWALHRGVPDTVRMSVETFDLWQKLGKFCAQL